jgi:L-arabinose isomerase
MPSFSIRPAPLGVLVIGRKRPGFDQEWNAVMRRKAGEALAAIGLASVGADTPIVDDQTIDRAMGDITAAGCEALLVLQPSIGNGQLMMSVVQRWPHPIVLWATPERADNPDVSSCSLVGQHLLASILRAIRHPFELVYGDPDVVATRDDLRAAIILARAHRKLRSATIGQIGGQPPGYLPMAPDAFVMREQLGVQLKPLSLPLFLERVRDVDRSAAQRDLEAVRALKLPANDITDSDLELQSHYYLALRAIVDEERLDALAIQEWPEISNIAGVWPYLAISRLAADGVPVGVEGDVDGALTCLIGELLGAGRGFVTDWLEHDDRTIAFWHPGTAPLDMLERPSLSKHFNIAKPTVVNGHLRVDQPVTVARLWRCDGGYVMTAFEGQTVPPRRSLTGNIAWMDVAGGGVGEWFDELCHAGMPHHPVVFEGHHATSLRKLARMLDVQWLAQP